MKRQASSTHFQKYNFEFFFLCTTATTAIQAKRESCSKNKNTKAEAKVCFDDSNVGEIEPLIPQDEKELPVDGSSPILKEKKEREKVIDEYMLEIASSEEGKFPDFRDKQSSRSGWKAIRPFCFVSTTVVYLSLFFVPTIAAPKN